MASTNPGTSTYHWVKPLPVSTTFFEDESIASWLVRAALNQGCDPLVLTQHYWSNYRLWTYDVDKGFNHIDSSIHADFAILANTSREQFDEQNLLFLTEKMGALPKTKNISTPWTLPLSKRNTKSLIGYQYCPLCLAEDKNAYLRLHWRFSWYTHCHIHHICMESNCNHCNMPYQPNLIDATQRYINQCHHCKTKLYDSYLRSILVVDEAIKFQKTASIVLQTGTGEVFNRAVNAKAWFDYMLFLINIARKTARATESKYMFYRLMREMGTDIVLAESNRPELADSSTGLAFDYLSVHERIRFISYAQILAEHTVEEWLRVCNEVKVSQNSFHWSARQRIPEAFTPVYSQLPINTRRATTKEKEVINPKSFKSVQKAWQRLQRKIEMRDSYEQQLIRTFDK